MVLKLGNVICPYAVSMSEAKKIGQWQRMFEVISKLQKWTNLPDTLPLFVEGRAFNVFGELDN